MTANSIMRFPLPSAGHDESGLAVLWKLRGSGLGDALAWLVARGSLCVRVVN